jgi:hypothetical protein
MEANELRIGNMVKYSDQFGEDFDFVIEIGSESCLLENYGELFYYNGLEPILLTPEWLERAGFELKGSRYYHHKYSGLPLEFELGAWFLKIDDHPYAEPLYVHQLQNLYFALTGEELSFNLNQFKRK